jgi:hypothetical protein
MTQERRKHPRYELLAHVRVKRGTVYYILDVENLSLSGAFVSTVGMQKATPFTEGQSIEMNLFLAEEMENVRVPARIARVVDDGEDGKRGFGAEFADLDDAAREGIAHLVEAARPSDEPPKAL